MAEEIVTKYLNAYKEHDYETMCSCLDPEYTFSDPAFPGLDAKESRHMFAMFIEGRNMNKMEVTFSDIQASGNECTARYICDYMFGPRHVINHITAHYTINPETGLIVKQVDTFDFWGWSQKALGMSGTILGWTPFFQGTVQKRAKRNLHAFIKRKESKDEPSA